MMGKKRQHPSTAYRWMYLPKKVKQLLSLILLGIVFTSACLLLTSNLVQGQNSPGDRSIQNLEEQEIRRQSKPTPTPDNSEDTESFIAPAIKTTPNAGSNQKNTNSERIRLTPLPNLESEEVKPQTVAPPPRIIPLPTEENKPPKIQPKTTPETAPKKVNDIVEEKSPPSLYNLEFNRSPVVGDRFHLQGLYREAKLGFTRPRSWKINNVKALIRFQHSPALLASRSNLTVRINGTSVGSIPLNLQQARIGQALFDIPPNRLGDYNEISIIAQQANTIKCEEANPQDPTLWTEVLPDSRLIFNYEKTPYRLDFSRYPFPFFDDLSLDINSIAFLLPKQVSESWLTTSARYSATLGRIADYRPLETRLIGNINQVKANERLVIIGTPDEQPGLINLSLPFRLAGSQFLDGNQNPITGDIGILMLTTIQQPNSPPVPILVATGNGGEGVEKAIQFLLQPQDEKLSTGRAILVDRVTEVRSPNPREWPGYLPEDNSFKLSDLKTAKNQNFQDVTVRGSGAPPIEFDFRALPDDYFKRGSSMNLVYSYGPQINPRTSAIEVLLDGVFIGGDRLTAESGETRRNLKVNLPEKLIKPNSKIKIAFRLNPREPGICGRVTDQQLTGTVHADTSFNLNRETSVLLPDLRLLQFGFPLAAPQDLSQTAIVLPDSPSYIDLMTLLDFSQRLGKLSVADSVQLNVYLAGTGTFNSQKRKNVNVIGIGVREKFPFPELLQTGEFKLQDLFSRQKGQLSIQTLADGEGIIKQVISPWNSQKVFLALTSQTPNGLNLVRLLFKQDPWFYQLQGDTVLISANSPNPSAFDNNDYYIESLKRSSQQRIENTNILSKISRMLQDNWFLLPFGILVTTLLLYGISQFYIKQIAGKVK